MRSPKLPSVLVTLMSILVILVACILSTGCTGLTYYDPIKACNGYTLICVDNVVRLVDMDGIIIKTWDIAGFPAKMFPNGSIMGQMGPRIVDLEVSEVIQVNWDGETEWSFSEFDEVDGVMVARAHHDFQKEGNPVGYYAPGQDPQPYGADVLVLGRLNTLDPEISAVTLLDDVVYEVDWDTKEVTLLWKSSEHFDEFGFDEEAKQLIYNQGGDYLHINSVSWVGPNKWYDPDTGEGDARFHPDNLIMDARAANIIWIANMVESDDYGVGEIVWKVGPDYSAGTPEGDKLGQIVGQHHAHVIPRGLPGEGNILVFDNGGFGGYPAQWRWYSRILEFDPITLDLIWSYEHPDFFSFYISSAQRLPNGNTLIDQGSSGRVFEVTPEGEIVWDFVESMQPFGRTYRAYRIPPEWIPGNPSGYTLWSELYEEPEGGGESTLSEPEPGNPPQELEGLVSEPG